MLRSLLILVFVGVVALSTAREAAAQVGPVTGFYYAVRCAYAVFCLFLCEEEQPQPQPQPQQAPGAQPKPDDARPAGKAKDEKKHPESKQREP